MAFICSLLALFMCISYAIHPVLKVINSCLKAHLEGDEIAVQLFADLVFYASLNFVGFYIRYVGEINMRRGFLDKRSCIETTFKLKYEKDKEVQSSQF